MNPNEIQRKVFAFMQEYHMLVPGESVLAGVSGGADSVCLLFLLLEWRHRFGGKLGVIHVNHGLRSEAAKEADFVKKLCADWDVDFFLKEEDVGAMASDLHLGTEEAGRLIRYRVFQELSAAWGHSKVAVAHNANDLAETMLFHLFRGSGIKGLSGIPPVRDHLIRPILCLERREAETYLEALGQPYCTDATNTSDEYTRNRIRRHILTYAKEAVSSQVIAHMSGAAAILRETEDYLEHQTGEAAKTCVSYRGKNPVMEVDSFCKLDPMLQKRILHQLLRDLVPEGKDISQIHVADMLDLFLREGNRSVCLPKGIRGRRSYQEVILFRDNVDQEDIWTPVRILPEDMSQEVKLLPLPEGRILKYRRIPFQKIEKIPRNQYTKWFDCDKIKGYLELRTRCRGDYFYIKGSTIEKEPAQYQKSIKKFMTDMKIPAADRNNLPLLAEGQHILWVIGYRISESYKVDEDTKWILEVSVDSNEDRKLI
jgi:tRNA(Ile)-lysidine synthase